MSEREAYVDFTVPYYDLVGISILMKKPRLETSLFKFMDVFDVVVWLCILAAYLSTSLLLWVFDTWSPYSYQNNRQKYQEDEETRQFNLKESLWFCMTSLTPQGGGEAPKNLSGQLLVATWWLFGFIIIASYTANLAAFLTITRQENVVRSLDDLGRQFKIQYSAVEGSSNAKYFERRAHIENKFYEYGTRLGKCLSIEKYFRIWKDLALNDSLTILEKSQLAVWDYPVSDKFTKVCLIILRALLTSTISCGTTWSRWGLWTMSLPGWRESSSPLPPPRGSPSSRRPRR